MVEKSSHVRGSKLAGMPLAGEQDEVFHPVQIGLFGPVAVMPPPDRFTRQIKQPWTRGLHLRTLYVMVIHVPLRWFNAELHGSPIWRNVGIREKMTG